MTTKLTGQFILAIAISFTFVACGGGEKKADETKAADTASAAKTDTTKAAAAPTVADAVTAAPAFYKLLQDTMGIRVIEATYKPGDSSALHSHADYAVYAIEGGAAEFIGKDGAKMMSEMKTGDENIRAAEVHSVKNTGKTTMKVLLVETTRPQGSVAADPLDATKVASKEYKLAKDSLGIRIINVTYKPGEVSAMHSHPDLAMYVLSASKAEFTGKDGKKQVHDLKPGMAMIVPADTHSVKNVGSTTAKVLLVEINRPQK
ncbi:MAG: cupin domain-containing protein [Bacteroidetes bacterium]|nr:cupin domain-containing protein [Bacteroidota bacterium]